MSVNSPEPIAEDLMWVNHMRRYLLGAITQDELMPLVQQVPPSSEAHRELRGALFETWCADCIVPLKSPRQHILRVASEGGNRRLAVLPFDVVSCELEPSEVFHVHRTPDTTAAVDKNGRVDLLVMEEIGFLEYQGVLVSRTIRPILVYSPDGSFKGVAENCAIILPAYKDEHELMEKQFFGATANADGLMYSFDAELVRLSPHFVRELGIPAHSAFACVARKSQFAPKKSWSKMNVDRGYLEGVAL